MATDKPRTEVFERLPLQERVWVLRQLQDETVGGALPGSRDYCVLGDGAFGVGEHPVGAGRRRAIRLIGGGHSQQRRATPSAQSADATPEVRRVGDAARRASSKGLLRNSVAILFSLVVGYT